MGGDNQAPQKIFTLCFLQMTADKKNDKIIQTYLEFLLSDIEAEKDFELEKMRYENDIMEMEI